jgi:hypothetical protein
LKQFIDFEMLKKSVLFYHTVYNIGVVVLLISQKLIAHILGMSLPGGRFHQQQHA